MGIYFIENRCIFSNNFNDKSNIFCLDGDFRLIRYAGRDVFFTQLQMKIAALVLLF